MDPKLCLGCSEPRAQNNPGLDGFSLKLVGNAGYTDFRHRRVRRENFFHLSRPYLVAARLDQILLPVDDEQVAVFVQITEVASVQPFPWPKLVYVVAQDTGSLVGPVPEFNHE